MARIRSLKPEYTTDRVTGRWPLDTQMVFSALWCHTDDEGRFEWELEKLRSVMFPYHPRLSLEHHLQRAVRDDRIKHYAVDGFEYGWIVHFTEHQKPNRPTPSQLPPYSPELEVKRAKLTEDSVSVHGGLTSVVEGRGEEGRGVFPTAERSGDEGTPPEVGREFEPPDAVAKDTRHSETIALFTRLWAEVRGGKYRVVGARDGKAVKSLLRDPEATPTEIERRMRLAFADPWFQQNGHVALFVSRWSNYDRRLEHANGVKKRAIEPPAPHAAFAKGGTVEL